MPVNKGWSGQKAFLSVCSSVYAIKSILLLGSLCELRDQWSLNLFISCLSLCLLLNQTWALLLGFSCEL